MSGFHAFQQSESGMDSSWMAIESVFRGIFEREYYTETGPLVRSLEQRLREATGFDHVVCIGSVWVAHLMLLDALDLQRLWIAGPVSVHLQSALAFFSKVRVVTEASSLGAVAGHAAVCNGALAQDNPTEVQWALASPATPASSWFTNGPHLESSIRVLDTSDLPLQTSGGADVHLGALNRKQHFRDLDGAYLATNDIDLADRLRTMRSSSGVSRLLPVKKTVNGRMSEAQAGIALLSLA